MIKPVLVFPAGMPRSLAYRERAEMGGQRVIGSSSLRYDPSRQDYSEWVYLPYITSSNFDEALGRVLKEFDIGGIFTPNPVVWDYLNRCIADSFPGVALVNPSPVLGEVAPYRKALQYGAATLESHLPVAAVGPVRPMASALQIAALFRHTEAIPGMCDHEKMRGLCEVFRYVPAGDIVEIGSWWGKSAFVLTWLARCYGIPSKLLCVDPWMNDCLIQNDEKGLVDRVPVDADEALTVFQLNLLAYAGGMVNYLRLPSIEAAREYRRSRVVTSDAFGETQYDGRIALLHIDGNHSYENARADMLGWCELVVPGGWIIVDDYIWPYGDGPQRVGDEFLSSHKDAISAAFVMGGALFIQISKSIEVDSQS